MTPRTSRRVWILATGLALTMSMFTLQAEKAQAQVVPRIVAAFTALDSDGYDLQSGKVKFLFVGCAGPGNLREITVTSSPYGSSVGDVSLAGAILSETPVVIGLPGGKTTARNLWFVDGQPASLALAFPRVDDPSYSCYAMRNDDNELEFSTNSSGMQWRITIYLLDFWEF